MKRLFLGVAFFVSLFVAPLTYADTTLVPVNDPITDTLHLWSEIAGVVSAITGDIVSIFNGHDLATSNAVGATQGQPASVRTAAGAFADAEQTQSPATSSLFEPEPAGSTPTVVNNYITNPIERVIDKELTVPTNYVRQVELGAELSALANALTAKLSPAAAATPPEYVAADGNPDVPFAASNAINNLSNVTISNPTVSGGSIPASSITGTISNLINAASGEIDSLTGTALSYNAATFTNATSTDFVATNATTTNLAVTSLTATGTSTLAKLAFSTTNCSTFGNGGKLTTDLSGNVVCAADQGGSGSTVGGADTQVQFNSSGSFQGASSFTFASSTGLLTVTNASTTNFTANYASTTNFVASNATSTSFFATNATTTNATSTNLFATLANFTTGLVNSLSGTQLTYTTASTTNLSNTGTAYFGGTATSSFNSAGQLTLANLASAVLGVNASGQVVASSTIGANLLTGTLGTVNGVTLNAGGAITVASTTLLGDSSAFSGVDSFTNASSNFAGTWQNFSPSHFQSAGTYLTALGNYATTTGTTISISSSTLSWNGLTLGNAFAISATGITVTPTVSGAISNSGLANSTIGATSPNGTLSLGSAAALGSTFTADVNVAHSNWWTAAQNFTEASTSQFTATSTVWFPSITNSLLATDQNGKLVATTSISTNLLTGALGTINGTSFSVGGSITVGSASTTLLSDNNTFSGGNLFTASTTIGNGNQSGGLTVSGGATTTGTLVVEGSSTSTFLGNIGISGNIVPSAGNTYTLGSPSYEWKDVYIGPGSLFVNGQEVVHTDPSQNVVLTANSNQNLEMQTSGSGSILFNSSGTGNIQLAGPVQITGGEHFSTSNSTPVLFNDGIEPGNLELTGNTIQATNTNGGISITPAGNGGTYFTSGNVGIGTTSPSQALSIVGSILASSSATSTFQGAGINLIGGCFSVNGTCVGASSASSTLLGDNNTFIGNDTFKLLNLSATTSSLLATNASGEVIATTSIGTNLLTGTLGLGNGGTGIASTPTYGQLLLGNGSGYTLTATSSLGLPTFANIASAYPFQLTGNATSTLTQFNGGLTAFASSTIGDNTQTGGLTINGGATTTGNAYFGGNVGVGTTTPSTALSIAANSPLITLDNPTSLTAWQLQGPTLTNGRFNIAGTSNYATTAFTKTLLSLSLNGGSATNAGEVDIGTTSNIEANASRLFVFGGNNGANVDVMGDQKVAGGDVAQLEVEGSDYGTQLTGSQSSLGLRYYGPTYSFTATAALGYTPKDLGVLDFGGATTSIITTGMNSTGASSALIFGTGYTQRAVLDGKGNLGIGTTTPWAQLSVFAGGDYGSHAASTLFAIGSTTAGTATSTLFDILSSGNVGIGTTSPASTISVSGNGYLTGGLGVGALNTTAGSIAATGNLTLGANSSILTTSGFLALSPASRAVDLYDGANAYNLYIFNGSSQNIALQGNGVSYFNGGNVGIGTTGPNDKLDVNGEVLIRGVSGGTTCNNSVALCVNFNGSGSSEYGSVWQPATETGGTYYLLFKNASGSNIGSIQENGSVAVAYNTSSDRRLKENIATTTEGLASLVQIPVDNFDFINDPTHTQVQGFIAQSLYPIYPEAVSTNGDNGVVPLGPTSTPWQVDYGRLTPLLVSAIQDIANISSTFEQNLIAWLGNAQNGIGEFFAEVGNFGQINTNELCVGSTCVTPAQFQAMVAAAAQSSPSGEGSASATTNTTDATDTPPVIQINGDNPAITQVGATYNDLGATITGPEADLNLGIQTYLNGSPMSPIVINTSAAAADKIDYVVADQNGLTSTSTRTVIIEAAEASSIVPPDPTTSTSTTNDDTATTTSP